MPAWRRFSTALLKPEVVQAEKLRCLLASHAETAYGRRFGLAKIRSYEEFRDRVPLTEYEQLAPWIARIMAGEERVLTPDPVTRLVPTSGSSGARKLIPFTATLQREFNAALAPWFVDLSRAYPSILAGSAYWSISPPAQSVEAEESVVPIGFDDDSAYLGGVRQRLAEATFAVPSALRLAPDVPTFRYLTLLCLLRRDDLRLVSVWHPSFFGLLLDVLPERWDELLHDLERGGCSLANTLPTPLRASLKGRPQPRRARLLRRLGPDQPEALWPGLALVSCWGDGQAGLPFRALQERLAGARLQAKGLLATEAFVSIPFRRHHPVALTAHFFEFEEEGGAVYRLHELQEGQRYQVIVSTAGGLCRYRLGDILEVAGRLGATPTVRFIGRAGNVVDLCGEKLSETFVTSALERACRAAGSAPSFAMLAPELFPERSPCYTVFVEGEVPPTFVGCLEKELRQNPHYALCRDLGQLSELRHFTIITRGYETFLKVNSSPGKRQGDLKPQTLSPRTDWREQFSLSAARRSAF